LILFYRISYKHFSPASCCTDIAPPSVLHTTSAFSFKTCVCLPTCTTRSERGKPSRRADSRCHIIWHGLNALDEQLEAVWTVLAFLTTLGAYAHGGESIPEDFVGASAITWYLLLRTTCLFPHFSGCRKDLHSGRTQPASNCGRFQVAMRRQSNVADAMCRNTTGIQMTTQR
jgi:hypothetical protein